MEAWFKSPFFVYWSVMGKTRKHIKDELDFNGGWSLGEASHHVGKRMQERVVKCKKAYKRKPKHRDGDLTYS